MSSDSVQIPTRVIAAQRDILMRFDRISNLWVAYHNSGKYPDDFGREFYYAVGKLLQGVNIDKLPLYHLDPEEVAPIVEHTKQFERALGGANGTMTEKGNTCRQKRQRQAKTQRRVRRKPARRT